MKKRLVVLVIILTFLLSIAGNGLASAQTPDSAQDYSVDTVLVKFAPGTPDIAKTFVHQRLGGRILNVIPGIDVHVVEIAKNKVEEKIKAYEEDTSVEYAEPDYIAKAVLIPNDHYFSNQWGMGKIGATEAWDTTKGESTVKIAICDTGIDGDHEDLAVKIIASKNFTTSLTLDDMYGHGTHVAGTAAAITNNSIGVAGVGYDSRLMNLKVLNDNGSGYYSWIANGITWAVDNGAKVINLSLGGIYPSNTLKNAVDYAWSRGSVIVAAAGNDNTYNPLYPAYYDNSIAVAATDQNDNKASFSNYGTWVDVSAPGVQIFSTLPNHANKIGILNYGYLSGTSTATPHVSGLAALVWTTDYGISNTSVRNRIELTADMVGTMWSIYGTKRINAYRAVAAEEPTPDDNIGPITSNVAASPNPTAGATSVILNAYISDVNTGGSNISYAEYFIDNFYGDGMGTSMSPSDLYFDSPVEMVTATIDVTQLLLGNHTLYVHGKDAKGNWGTTSSTTLNKTEKPLGNPNDMYVWSIDFRSMSWGWWIRWLYVDITIRRDSNANGKADISDEAVANATVDMVLTNQTTGQIFSCKGVKTNSTGVATYYIYGAPKGRYIAQVSGLTHAAYSWNKVLDRENPSEPYILASDITWPNEKIYILLKE